MSVETVVMLQEGGGGGELELELEGWGGVVLESHSSFQSSVAIA